MQRVIYVEMLAVDVARLMTVSHVLDVSHAIICQVLSMVAVMLSNRSDTRVTWKRIWRKLSETQASLGKS